jgi:hypothetical protein
MVREIQDRRLSRFSPLRTNDQSCNAGTVARSVDSELPAKNKPDDTNGCRLLLALEFWIDR